mgnify:FL=1
MSQVCESPQFDGRISVRETTYLRAMLELMSTWDSRYVSKKFPKDDASIVRFAQAGDVHWYEVGVTQWTSSTHAVLHTRPMCIG